MTGQRLFPAVHHIPVNGHAACNVGGSMLQSILYVLDLYCLGQRWSN